VNHSEKGPVRLVVVSVDELREIVADIVTERVSELLENARKPVPLLDRQRLAQALDVSTDTVDRLRREGAPARLVGDAPRFVLAEVLEWLKTREKPLE
jgi:hypothetical protein